MLAKEYFLTLVPVTELKMGLRVYKNYKTPTSNEWSYGMIIEDGSTFYFNHQTGLHPAHNSHGNQYYELVVSKKIELPIWGVDKSVNRRKAVVLYKSPMDLYYHKFQTDIPQSTEDLLMKPEIELLGFENQQTIFNTTLNETNFHHLTEVIDSDININPNIIETMVESTKLFEKHRVFIGTKNIGLPETNPKTGFVHLLYVNDFSNILITESK